MKFLVILLLCLWVVQSSALTVVTWNLEWFPGGKANSTPEEQQVHMKAAKAALKQLNPDVFIGIEMKDESSFKKLISAVPGLKSHVVSNFRVSNNQKGLQQIGIASRWPAQSAWAEPWINVVNKLPRGFSFTALENTNTHKFLMVYGLHLKSNLNRGKGDKEDQANRASRNESARQLIIHTESMEKIYKKENIEGWVIGGDFNTNDDGQFANDHVIANFEEAGFWNTWKNVPKEKRLTWTGKGRYKPTTFDYILLKGLGKPSAVAPTNFLQVSDHLPVIVTLSNFSLHKNNPASKKKSEGSIK
ncbi:MAG: endonuclease/exonuclease/phosphatase family protein [Verrucomicrobiia bacterium]